MNLLLILFHTDRRGKKQKDPIQDIDHASSNGPELKGPALSVSEIQDDTGAGRNAKMLKRNSASSSHSDDSYVNADRHSYEKPDNDGEYSEVKLNMSHSSEDPTSPDDGNAYSTTILYCHKPEMVTQEDTLERSLKPSVPQKPSHLRREENLEYVDEDDAPVEYAPVDYSRKKKKKVPVKNPVESDSDSDAPIIPSK